MIEVELPDGSIAEFPDGTSQDVIVGALRKQFSPQKEQPSLAQKAIEPITSYPETYSQLNRESREQMSRGVGQLQNAVDNYAPADVLKGVANTALGAAGYVFSPVNAALRTVVGKPIEEATGIPKEYTEFAASFAVPGSGAGKLGSVARAEKAAVPTTETLFSKAKEGFRSAERAGDSFAPETLSKLADDIGSSVKNANGRDYLAPRTFRAIEELRLEGPGTITDVRGTRQLLGEIAQGGDKFERRAATLAIKEIDGFLKTSVPSTARTLSDANANFAAASRSKQLEEAAEVAGLRTGRAGYGGNSVNAMRQVLSPIVEKAIKGRTKGFSSEEIAAMREIVEGTPVTNSLRMAGQLSPSKGIMQTGAGLATGVGTAAAFGAGPGAAVALAIPAIGAASNKLASVLTGKQIDRLQEMVRKRSPAYAEAVKNSANRYFDSAEQFASEPSAKNFAQVLTASRALSSGLVRDGVQVSSADLLRLLQGSVPARTEDENPEPERVIDQ